METPLPLKSDFFGASQDEFVHRIKGASGQGLSDYRIDMIPNPRRMNSGRVLRQGCFGESDRLACVGKSFLAWRFRASRNLACTLVGFGLFQEIHAPESFAEPGIIELSRSFEGRSQDVFLYRRDAQGNFAHKR